MSGSVPEMEEIASFIVEINFEPRLERAQLLRFPLPRSSFCLPGHPPWGVRVPRNLLSCQRFHASVQ